MLTQNKMYVLVRKDLDAIYRMVQGSHALAQYAIEHPIEMNLWGNRTIVFLGVRNEDALQLIEYKLRMKNKIYSTFREPDLHNQLTAIACYDGKMFEDLTIVTV